MKVLVTGGAGYLGSVLSRRLLTTGHQVRILDSLAHGGDALLGNFIEEGFEFIQGDVRSKNAVDRALEGVDAVVHLAAIVGDPACAREPEIARQINQDASINLFEQSNRAGVKRFIFASTCSNYGRMADPSQYVDENSELRPVSLYAETKVAVENVLLRHPAEQKLCVTVLRLATIFGLSPRMRFDLTVNEFSMELVTKGKITVFGEQFWRPYIHVRDVARAMALVLESPPSKVASRVFNVGDTTQNYQKSQIVELIRSQLKTPVKVETVHKQEDPRDYRVSFKRIQDELGFKITRTVNDGIREIIAAIQEGVVKDFDNPRYRN